MKLLTRLIRRPGYTYGYGDQYELTRDAAMAHALVMAMNEQPYTTSDVYMERADEIMASWGYSE